VYFCEQRIKMEVTEIVRIEMAEGEAVAGGEDYDG
jgi:hypothetical protein